MSIFGKKVVLLALIMAFSFGSALLVNPQNAAACAAPCEPSTLDETAEIPGNGIDDDCDGLIDEDYGNGDSVPSMVENAGPFEGDGNGDSVLDSEQQDVASLPNPNDTESPNSYLTVEVLPSEEEESGPGDFIFTPPSMWVIESVTTVAPSSVESTNGSTLDLPYGLLNINLTVNQQYAGPLGYYQTIINLKNSICSGPLGTADPVCGIFTQIAQENSEAKMRISFDRVIDHSQLSISKLLGGSYVNYPATIQDEEVAGKLRTTIRFSLFDGGQGDTDGVMNGRIVDPIGPSKPAAIATAAATTTSVVAVPQLANTGIDSLLVSLLAVSVLITSLFVVTRKTA